MKSFKSLNRSVLASLIVGLVSLFAIGCGSSNTNTDPFVFVGDQEVAPATGNLLFQFANPQVQAPTNTISFRFDVFNGNILIFTETNIFATLITLTDVPNTADTCTITAIGDGQAEVGTLTTPVEVITGGDNQVDLSAATFTAITLDGLTLSPDPLLLPVAGTGTFSNVINFSSGNTAGVASSEITYSGFDTNVVTEANGVFTGVAAGNTTVTANFTLNGMNVTDNANITVSP